MPKISLFNYVTDTIPSGEIEIIDFLLDIQNGRWKKQVDAYRSGKADKKTLPAVTISGLFEKRSERHLKAHSGFICIDIDELPSDEIILHIKADKTFFSVFKTVSGKGLALICKCLPEKHKQTYEYLAGYVFDRYGIVVDPAPKNVASLRFVSYDPELHINNSAVLVNPPSIERKKIPTVDCIATPSQVEQLVATIVSNGVNIAETYHDYLYIGFALAEEFGEAGRSYYHSISSMSAKYNARHCDKQYDYCLQRRGKVGKKITIGTLFYLAKQAGIEPPQVDRDTIKKAIIKKQPSTPDEAHIAEQIKNTTPASLIGKDQQALIELLADWIIENYNIRINEITRQAELGKERLTREDMNSIYLRARSFFNTTRINKELVESVIYSNYMPSYSPFDEYFNKHKPALNGSIDRLCSTIEGISTIEKAFIRRWIIGVAAAIHGEPVRNVLVLVGKQNTGKTEWFRRLLPAELQPYYAESTLDAKKDTELLMCQKLIIMNDEFGGMTREDEKRFKSLTSARTFSLRAPYGRQNEDYKRLAVLCGTSNDTQIISDMTGNTRILPVTVSKILFDEYNSIDKHAIIAEAMALYKAGKSWQLSFEEMQHLATISEQYSTIMYEYELISKYFEPDGKEVMTSTEIKQRIELYSNQRIINMKKFGQALAKYFGDSVVVKRNGVSIRGYRCTFVEEENNQKQDKYEMPF